MVRYRVFLNKTNVLVLVILKYVLITIVSVKECVSEMCVVTYTGVVPSKETHLQINEWGQKEEKNLSLISKLFECVKKNST